MIMYTQIIGPLYNLTDRIAQECISINDWECQTNKMWGSRAMPSQNEFVCHLLKIPREFPFHQKIPSNYDSPHCLLKSYTHAMKKVGNKNISFVPIYFSLLVPWTQEVK